ncbi:MAG: hypothetical protein ABEK04_00260 [Candidatus Nanohalobium sp.]
MSDAETGKEPDNKMRERAEESNRKLWLLTQADRKLIATGLTLAIFLAVAFLGIIDPSPLQHSMEVSDPTETLFQALVTALITGVTLVVTLNQLVLSQELGPVGDQRIRMEKAMQSRRDVEDIIDRPVSPQEPSKFLKNLVDEIENRAEQLSEIEADSELEDEIENYVEGLKENAQQVSEGLEGSQFGTFGLLSSVLNFNYSWKITEARRIRNSYGDSIGEELEEKFDGIEDALELFGPAREHFKTLYFQWELVNLSRAMLYTSVPALVVASCMVLFYDPNAVTGTTSGLSNDVLFTSLAFAVSLTPFTILLSYILRIVTVAKRTLSIGPFVLRNEK